MEMQFNNNTKYWVQAEYRNFGGANTTNLRYNQINRIRVRLKDNAGNVRYVEIVTKQ